MNAKHTPGPWIVEGFWIKSIVRAANGVIVAIRHRLGAGEHEANALLIAAAPELLEVSARLVRIASREYHGDDDADEFDSMVIQANYAIAKATGEQNGTLCQH